jgi:CheY-like chemotaxis protein
VVESNQALLPVKKSGRRTTQETELSITPSARRLAVEGALLPTSVKNGVQPPVVLVIEDEFFLRLNIVSCLQEAGYAVVEAASGEEAIALCHSGTSIDVVFTDVNLGGYASGWDVAECFRTVRPGVPVVYTSGRSLDAGRCVGGSAFVAKPYRESDILKACRRLTEGARSNGAKR